MKNIISNRKHWFSICLFLLLTSSGLFAQKLSEKLGGISTNFTIVSGEDTLNTESQIIIKRGKFDFEKNYTGDDEGGYGYGYGYGYESFHFEFTSKEKIAKTKTYNKLISSVWYCTFHCYDKDGKQILEMFLPSSRLENGSGTSYVYSLNLIGIPIVILDNTVTIQIERQHHSWRNKK